MNSVGAITTFPILTKSHVRPKPDPRKLIRFDHGSCVRLLRTGSASEAGFYRERRIRQRFPRRFKWLRHVATGRTEALNGSCVRAASGSD